MSWNVFSPFQLFQQVITKTPNSITSILHTLYNLGEQIFQEVSKLKCLPYSKMGTVEKTKTMNEKKTMQYKLYAP